MLKRVLCVLLFLGLVIYPADAARKSSGYSAKAKAPSQVKTPAKARKAAPAKPRVKPVAQPKKAPAAPAMGVSWICVEANSGLVLGEDGADRPGAPASMIKMMLMLLVSEGLQSGSWTLETPITVTPHAQTMGGTQVYVNGGDTWPLNRLMEAIAVASANDAAMAVAEGLWGSEEKFKARMNERARELGMFHSQFHSVHGLPPGDGQKPDVTTPHDMSLLARYCVRDSQIMRWVGLKEFQFKADQPVKKNTNQLLWRMPGCDGLKTGYIRAAGFCITATALRNDVRLIAVVMGCENDNARFNLARNLLDDAFSQVRRVRVIARGEPLKSPVRVGNCATREVNVTAVEDLWVVVKDGDEGKLDLLPELPRLLQAPLASGAIVGEVTAQLSGWKLASVPLAVPRDLPEAGWRWKLKSAVAR